MPRRDRSKLNKAFDTLPDQLTKEEIDLTFYGAGDIAALDSQRRDAAPVDIFMIYPDVTQPRRVFPSEIRHAWTGNPAEIADLFQAWFLAITSERYERMDTLPEAVRREHSYFDVGAYLEGSYLDDSEDDGDYDPGPIERSFRQVVDLAATIRRDGLINPVTIAHAGVDYRLETGERRWLAYHLLYAFYDGSAGRPNERQQWQRIPAFTVDEASIWRMAHENNVRDDLNAIGKARQFALLLMDVYRQRGVEFKAHHDLVAPGDCDRVYYAQVADGSEYPMPRGGAEKLLNAMGFTSKSQLREHRQLLALPDQVWQWADDLNWSQRHIRDMARQANGDLKRLLKIAQLNAHQDGLSVGAPTLSDIPNGADRPPALLPPTGPHRRGKILISREDQAKLRELMRIRGGVGQANSSTKQVVRQEITAARRWLTQLEQALDREPEN
jgi:hypothetical protein